MAGVRQLADILPERAMAIEEREYGNFYCLVASPPRPMASKRGSTGIPACSRAS